MLSQCRTLRSSRLLFIGWLLALSSSGIWQMPEGKLSWPLLHPPPHLPTGSGPSERCSADLSSSSCLPAAARFLPAPLAAQLPPSGFVSLWYHGGGAQPPQSAASPPCGPSARVLGLPASRALCPQVGVRRVSPGLPHVLSRWAAARCSDHHIWKPVLFSGKK